MNKVLKVMKNIAIILLALISAASYADEDDWCGETIFNLKLPMKKRYQEVKECLVLMEEILANTGKVFEISSKHLYHDREEITCHIRQIHRVL